jgi:hypothetical protein
VNGYIKLYKKIREWKWYKSSETYHLFSHLILSANFKDSEFMSETIKRGQLLTGLFSLSNQTGISIRAIRTGLERLKQSGEITIKTTNRFSIITICKYEDYQGQDIENDKPTTSQRQTNDKQTTTSEEVKNDKNDKNDKKTYSSDFERFWDAYPRKTAKFAAAASFSKLPPGTLNLILTALSWQCKQRQWIENNGSYIPIPTTYLNQRRWEDQPLNIQLPKKVCL